MPLKVTWKRGMRLSTEVFEASDTYIEESIRLSNIIATGSRFGLIPWEKPFELSVNVSNNVLEVVSVSCHGVTKSGINVDIEFDSNFTNTFDTRVAIPSSNEEDAFLLIVKFQNRQWREVNDMYSEPLYTFELIGENSPIDCNSLPIGLLVNQYGWRLDETDFVPPCIYTSAHPKFAEQLNRAKLTFKAISDRCLNAQNCVARQLICSIWKSAAESFITIDKNRESITPANLFEALQKTVASFIIGCSTDEYITLENPELFTAYYHRSFDERNIYRDIQKGLELCNEISIKLDAVCEMREIKETPVMPMEKPKAKPQLPPESKPTGRNRWEGIEI